MLEFLRRLKRFIEIKPNFKKLVNYSLNKISKSLIRSGYALGMPHRVFLELTNSCNLHCTLCPTGNGLLRRDKLMISFGKFKKIIDQMADYLIEAGIGGFGEPFLNKDIYSMLGYFKDKGIFVEIYTNLFPLDEEGIKKIVDLGVDKLIVSLDAWDANSYLCYKGVDGFDKVLGNLRYLLDFKRQERKTKPSVNLQFIMIKDSLGQISKIKEMVEGLGVEILTLKTPNPYLGSHQNHPNVELEERFLSSDFNRYRFNESKILACPWVWDSLIIYASGDIGPCCYDAQGDYVFGNIFSEDIGSIWNNKKYREFRKNAIHNTDNNQLCALCMERHKGARIKIEYPINKS